MLRFFTRKKAQDHPPSGHGPAKATPGGQLNGNGAPPGPVGLAIDEGEQTVGRFKGKQRADKGPEDDEGEATRREKQVAFVSPVPTPTPEALLANVASAHDRRSPSPPLPSLPAARHAAATAGPTGTVRAAADTYHHPPASMTARPIRSPGSPQVGPASQPSHVGHSADDGDRTTAAGGFGGATSPAMSFASSRRASGGILPGDTWGGTVIGGNQGEDIYQPLTWSEMNDLDLVENLGGRERTRQEVLWEIVASEERYVDELLSLKRNYVDPLLHPLRSPPLGAGPFAGGAQPSSPGTVSSSRRGSDSNSPNPNSTSDFLPIAARFARAGSSRASISSKQSEGPDFLPDIESEDSHTPSGGRHPSTSRRHPSDTTHSSDTKAPSQHSHFRSRFAHPFHFGTSQSEKGGLPSAHNGSSASLAEDAKGKTRHHLKPAPQPNKLHKLDSKDAGPPSAAVVDLPQSLRIVLDVIGDSLLRGHQDLSIKLKEKYLEQFPLVRDLTSVWADQAWIIQKYTVYVLHLERALAELDRIFAAADPKAGSFSRAERTLAQKFMRLEEKASDQGEVGIAICLSKPFQRLLKYPLLFQNLLYHTDASTHEYESAGSMAVAIDSLVRSIEDEKVSEDQRDRARDAWSRIDGVIDKALMIPQSNRSLVSEEPVWQPPPGMGRRTVSDAIATRALSPASSPASAASRGDRVKTVKGQKSLRRLSDMVASDAKEPALGSKRDVWLVVFSDVVVRCQRTGVTQLSAVSWGKKKPTGRKVSRRHSLPGKERNLYRFIQVEKWEVHRPEPAGAENGVASASGRSRRDSQSSQMSFVYDLDDPKPTEPAVLQQSTNQAPRPALPTAPPSKSPPTSPRGLSQTTQSVMAKRTPAVDKFQNRLGAASSAASARSPSPRVGAATPRTTSAAERFRYEAPTSSSAAKARNLSPRPMSPPPARGVPRRRAGSGTALPSSARAPGSSTAVASTSSPRRRAGSGPSSPSKKVEPSTAAPAVPTLRPQQSQDFTEFTRYFASPPGSQDPL